MVKLFGMGDKNPASRDVLGDLIKQYDPVIQVWIKRHLLADRSLRDDDAAEVSRSEKGRGRYLVSVLGDWFDALTYLGGSRTGHQVDVRGQTATSAANYLTLLEDMPVATALRVADQWRVGEDPTLSMMLAGLTKDLSVRRWRRAGKEVAGEFGRVFARGVGPTWVFGKPGEKALCVLRTDASGQSVVNCRLADGVDGDFVARDVAAFLRLNNLTSWSVTHRDCADLLEIGIIGDAVFDDYPLVKDDGLIEVRRLGEGLVARGGREFRRVATMERLRPVVFGGSVVGGKHLPVQAVPESCKMVINLPVHLSHADRISRIVADWLKGVKEEVHVMDPASSALVMEVDGTFRSWRDAVQLTFEDAGVKLYELFDGRWLIESSDSVDVFLIRPVSGPNGRAVSTNDASAIMPVVSSRGRVSSFLWRQVLERERHARWFQPIFMRLSDRDLQIGLSLAGWKSDCVVDSDVPVLTSGGWRTPDEGWTPAPATFQGALARVLKFPAEAMAIGNELPLAGEGALWEFVLPGEALGSLSFRIVVSDYAVVCLSDLSAFGHKAENVAEVLSVWESVTSLTIDYHHLPTFLRRGPEGRLEVVRLPLSTDDQECQVCQRGNLIVGIENSGNVAWEVHKIRRCVVSQVQVPGDRTQGWRYLASAARQRGWTFDSRLAPDFALRGFNLRQGLPVEWTRRDLDTITAPGAGTADLVWVRIPAHAVLYEDGSSPESDNLWDLFPVDYAPQPGDVVSGALLRAVSASDGRIMIQRLGDCPLETARTAVLALLGAVDVTLDPFDLIDFGIARTGRDHLPLEEGSPAASLAAGRLVLGEDGAWIRNEGGYSLVVSGTLVATVRRPTLSDPRRHIIIENADASMAKVLAAVESLEIVMTNLSRDA